MADDDANDPPWCRASFSIFGPELIPDDISRMLGLVPDHTHLKGDYPANNPGHAPYPHGMWLLKSRLQRYESLETHLEALLTVLIRRQSEIQKLSEVYTVRFSCSLHNTIGFELPPSILGQIASLSAKFGVSVYA